VQRTQPVYRWLTLALFVLGTAAVLPLRAEEPNLAQLRARAEQLEKARQWDKACDVYEQILARDRNLPHLKPRYLLCLRHARLAGRHRDASYRTQVLDLSLSRSLDLYEEVVSELRDNYIERGKLNLTRLFREGLTELRLALEDETFRAAQLPGVSPAAILAFKNQLRDTWGDRTVGSLKDARGLVRDVAWACHKELGIRPSVVVLEFACGACDVLDEYTMFLTPAQLTDFYASVNGSAVGIGIDVTFDGMRLLIADVVPGSPAALCDAGLRVGDQVLSIDKRKAGTLTAETAADLLKGEVGSVCEVEVLRQGDMMPRTLRLVRQPVAVASVASIMLDRDMGIGYVRITAFQKTTLQELDEAVARLRMEGTKVLILDLRGNSGGLFDVAVQVAERFLSEGVIVSTQSQVPEFNKTHAAHNMNPLTWPMVILVDGDTASAAEVVAGALKDNQRGKLVGQTTYGKGTSQRVFKLEAAPAGIRVTLARFFSPSGRAYSGRGVTPDVLIERTPRDLSPDLRQQPQVRMALQVARGLWTGRQDEP
jgi:carboxyl-terminal processing protease